MAMQWAIERAFPSAERVDFALMCGAENGDVRMVTAALARGARLETTDGMGLHPLDIAAQAGKADAVRFLIARGADVNGIVICCGRERTPLMLAVYAGQDQAVRELIGSGADVNASDDRGETALMMAALAFNDPGSLRCARLLIEAGADVSARDDTGDDALSYAVVANAPKAMKTLLRAAARAHAHSRHCKTASTGK
jgi:ankyrin repeat protein